MIKKVLYGLKLFLVFISLFLYSILAISVKTFLLRGDTFYSWCLFAFFCFIPAYLLLSKIDFSRENYMKKVKIFLSLSVIVFLFFIWLIYELFFIGTPLFSTHEIPFYIVLVLPLLNIILFSSLFIRYKKILAQLSFIFYVFAVTVTPIIFILFITQSV